ncbi:hypothetical protein [Pararhizobium sp.]|uniref:hypothetical protein n=1 Tax=Pararhizobium sp. TaxID=1977563 RepID=UPI002720D3AF|nr:hypothetical protein [Pararhizobium sp.]MDO9417963.1 hypothetical protein [Pararhizobium sp.]
MAIDKNLISGILKGSRAAGQTISDGLEAIREEITALKEKRDESSFLPVDEASACQRVDLLVARLSLEAQKHAPGPERFTSSPEHWRLPSCEPAQLLFAYMAGGLAEAIKQEVRKIYEDGAGLTDAERSKRFAALDHEILQAELIEEAIIRTSEASGFKVLRRFDADPRAVLAHESALP